MEKTYSEELINDELIFTAQDFKTKDEIIEFMSQRMHMLGRLNDYQTYIQSVHDREKCFPTCIGFGIAIPHGKSEGVKTPTFAFMNLKQEIMWNEEEEVNLIFLLAVPVEASNNYHLKVLAELSKKLIEEDFREKLKNLGDKKEICDMLTFHIN